MRILTRRDRPRARRARSLAHIETHPAARPRHSQEDRLVVYIADVQQLEEGTAVSSHGTASRCAGGVPEEHSYRVDPLAALQERELSLGAREADLLALEQLVARAAGRETEWFGAREAELDRREGDLHRREVGLNRVRASLTYAPATNASRALDRPGT